SAATMAFPANMLGVGPEMGGGDYPPPPPPLGGMGAPAPQQPQQGYPQAQTALSPGSPSPGAGASAYVATQSQPEPHPHDAGRQPPRAIAGARGPPSNKAAPFLVGLVVLVLVGGGATAWVLLGRNKTNGGPATANSGAASASAAPSAIASTEPIAA